MLLLVGRKAFGAVAVVFCITVVLCIYGVGAWFSDLGLGGQIRLILAASAVFDLLLVVVFTYGWRLLWRCIPALNNLLFPDWNGTWDVEINWQWNEKTGTVCAKAKVKQSLLKLSISLQSERTYSETRAVVPKKHTDSGRPELHYLYDARPTGGYQDDNPAHSGAATLMPDLDNNDVLRGNYFTDRSSKGHYVMTRTSSAK